MPQLPDSSEPEAAAARSTSLRHVHDDAPGITRRHVGTGFSYRHPNGAAVRDSETLARIKALAIPPAWSDVWICPLANGHIQATGRDARRRKQYRYHARWSQVRDADKYERMQSFGEALPRIRARVTHDLARDGLPREKVLAVVVRLLETTFIRVGNEEYARTNHSFGLTTMRNRHVDVSGTAIHFRFRGKSGKHHDVDVDDRRLARLVKKCRELPGQELFQYLDEAGEAHPVTSADVNEYLHDVAGEEFTAKDFRTWAGTLLAAHALVPSRCFDDGVSPKSAQVAAVAAVAERLGNTPAVCRKCYIHPAVLDAYLNQPMHDLWVRHERARRKRVPGLHVEEVALLRFLAAADPAVAQLVSA
jgi:DNA topoisomerase-1